MHRYEVDWNDNDKVKEYIEHLWSKRDRHKAALERWWLTIIQAYEGLEFNNYKYVENQLVKKLKVPTWRVRLTVNLMLPYVRSAAAKHLRNRPIFDVIPATNSNSDILVADAGKQTLQSFWFRQDINYEFIDLLYWVALLGVGFTKTSWNPDAGHLIKLSPKDFLPEELLQPGQDPRVVQQALQQAQTDFQNYVNQEGSDEMPAGEMELSIPTPFDMYMKDCGWLHKSDWVIQSTMRDVSYYADRGVDPDQMTRPSNKDVRFKTYNRKVTNMYGASAEMLEDEILEINLWQARSRGLKRGRWVTYAGGVIVNNTENPYDHGELPFNQFFADRMPGKMWSFSGASQILPLVKEQQKSLSQIAENRNLMARPKWAVPHAARIKRTSITSEPGEIIRYFGGIPPTQLTPGNMPRYVFDAFVMNQKAMDHIMAQQEASRGINPPGGRSAAVVQELAATDDGSYAVAGLGFDTGFSSAGRKLLSIARQFYREDRLLVFLGDNNAYQSRLLKKGSLIGDNQVPGADYNNVRVTQFSQFGLSRAGQFEVLKTLLQFNIFDPTPKSRQKVLKFIQMGYFEDEIDEYKADRANAHRENLMLSQGQPIRPAYGATPEAYAPGIEDHDTTHLESHFQFMKTDEYKALPPQIQSLFQYHVNQHKLLEVTKLVEPQVLAIAGQVMAANMHGIPLNLLGNQNNENQSTN